MRNAFQSVQLKGNQNMSLSIKDVYSMVIIQ